MDGREYQVTRNRSLNRKSGRLGITNFPHHDDIGILTQETSESIGEIESDLWVDLCVIDSLDAVFYRIFKGGNILLFGVEPGEHGVECRRFTRSGWSDDEDEPELVF